jgi:hypothetical protein
VATEVFLPDEGGWVLVDPLYDAVFADEEGRLLDAPGFRDRIREDQPIRITQGDSGKADPWTAPERLLKLLGQGLLEGLLFIPPRAEGEAGSPPLMPRARVLSEGDGGWWKPTRRLQWAVLIVPVAGILLWALYALAGGSP